MDDDDDDDDESVIIQFCQFLKKHTYAYVNHTWLYHSLAQGQILPDFLLFPPTKSRQAMKVTFSRVLPTHTLVPWEILCNQEGGDITTS